MQHAICRQWRNHNGWLTDWVKVLHPTQQKIGHFGDVLPSQSLGIVLKKLNLTQQKQTTQEQNSLSWNITICQSNLTKSHIVAAYGQYYPSPLKIAPSNGGSGTPSNTWFLAHTQVHNPNGISIGSAVFAGLTIVTDRLTDHATSITIGRIYVCR